MRSEPIDAVYTWVDGAEAGFVERLNAFRRSHPAAAPAAERFQDHGELRFSLRSLETYAPWIRHVYIVTSGQIPRWLNPANERVTVVDVTTIFAESADLPTFNSAAIDVHLHRIHDLSNRFLHLDDDLFFGRQVQPEDFITPAGGQYLHFENLALPSGVRDGVLWQQSQSYTQGVLDRIVGIKRPRLVPAHVPRLRDQEILARLERLLPDEFRLTASLRVRSPNNLYLDTLYSHCLLESPAMSNGHVPRVLKLPSRDYAFIALENRPWKMMRRFLGVLALRPKFYCINDHLPGSNPLIARMLGYFLSSYFPRPSSFER